MSNEGLEQTHLGFGDVKAFLDHANHARTPPPPPAARPSNMFSLSGAFIPGVPAVPARAHGGGLRLYHTGPGPQERRKLQALAEREAEGGRRPRRHAIHIQAAMRASCEITRRRANWRAVDLRCTAPRPLYTSFILLPTYRLHSTLDSTVDRLHFCYTSTFSFGSIDKSEKRPCMQEAPSRC